MSRVELQGQRLGTPSERAAIAQALYRARDMDEGEYKHYYNNNADLLDYFIRLQGLSQFLDYVKSLGGNRLVLDIGAGTTRAVSELEKSPLGEGLNFKATVLSRTPKIAENLGFEKTIQTNVERLRRIDNTSVSGIISVSGMAYSAVPELAIQSVDRVLVPGGVIKASFRYDAGEPTSPLFARGYSKPYNEFADALLGLGYEADITEVFESVVLLAIKPGGKIVVSSSELIVSDNGIRDYLERTKSLHP